MTTSNFCKNLGLTGQMNSPNSSEQYPKISCNTWRMQTDCPSLVIRRCRRRRWWRVCSGIAVTSAAVFQWTGLALSNCLPFLPKQTHSLFMSLAALTPLSGPPAIRLPLLTAVFLGSHGNASRCVALWPWTSRRLPGGSIGVRRGGRLRVRQIYVLFFGRGQCVRIAEMTWRWGWSEVGWGITVLLRADLNNRGGRTFFWWQRLRRGVSAQLLQ